MNNSFGVNEDSGIFVGVNSCSCKGEILSVQLSQQHCVDQEICIGVLIEQHLYDFKFVLRYTYSTECVEPIVEVVSTYFVQAKSTVLCPGDVMYQLHVDRLLKQGTTVQLELSQNLHGDIFSEVLRQIKSLTPNGAKWGLNGADEVQLTESTRSGLNMVLQQEITNSLVQLERQYLSQNIQASSEKFDEQMADSDKTNKI